MNTEDQLEQLCLEWFQSIGYDIAPDGRNKQNFWTILLIKHKKNE
jgi:hypothetical protein